MGTTIPSATGINRANVSNGVVATLSWLGVAVHVGVAVVVWRRGSALPLLPLVNLVTALCVVIYWSQRWYGYVANGTTWYFTDQLVPTAAVGVCILAALSLSGRYAGTAPHWIVFTINTGILIAVALFFTYFRINRLF